MFNNPTRRDFLRSSIAATVLGSTSTAQVAGRTAPPAAGASPVIISSKNGFESSALAMKMLRAGGDALDAVIAAVNVVEEDPEDLSVGYGGLPNEEGVVELDASCMHGPTHKAGAVAALRGIKTPSKIARLVMQRTDHVLLVGQGALRFAKAHGFQEHNLLTDKARRAWLRWKENVSQRDDWLGPEAPDEGQSRSSSWSDVHRTYGTINCCALDARGNLSGVTTTSGLSYKIPGRVGDSPIIGAGLYVDNEVGAAGSTGRGEAVIQNCGAFTVVERMRMGKSPEEACLEALKYIDKHSRDPSLRRRDGRPNFDVKFYAVNKRGEYGAAALWSQAQFAVHDERSRRLEDCAYLYKRPPAESD